MKRTLVFSVSCVMLLALLLTVFVGCNANKAGDGDSGELEDSRPLLTLASNIEGAAVLTGGGHYDYNDDLNIKAVANSGYYFLGWYNGNDLLSTSAEYNCKMWDKNVTLEAKFIALPTDYSGAEGPSMGESLNQKYTLCVQSSAPNLGKISVNDGENMEEKTLRITTGTNVKALSLTVSSKAFLGWYDEAGNLVMANGLFTFSMPPFDYTLQAKWACECEEYTYLQQKECFVCVVCGGKNADSVDGMLIDEKNGIKTLIEYRGSKSSVEIPEGLTVIGEGAFKNCSTLQSVTIPGSVTTICEKAFYNCSSLTSITVANGLTSIGRQAFAACGKLTNVNVPASVTYIGSNAFSGCNRLTSITVPFVGENLNGTGNTCFSHIFDSSYGTIPSSLKTVVILGGTAIAGDAFYRCENLTSITIPNSVTYIGEHAFYKCSNLTSLVIPDSVTFIGEGALSSCSRLENLSLPFVGESRSATGEKAHLGYCFGIAYSRSSDSIGDAHYYYRNSNSLYTYTGLYYAIPNSLKTVSITGAEIIDKWAFRMCKTLTSISIGENVASIGSEAFYGCTELRNVTFANTTGWWYSTSAAATSGTEISSAILTNSGTAATCLKTTYCDYYWKRG